MERSSFSVASSSSVPSFGSSNTQANNGEEKKQILIACWNVAGWSKSLQQIRNHHKSFKNWFDSMQIDILCLQEVKKTFSELSNDAKQFGAENETDFEFFFNLSKTGMNGVATIARKGFTKSAKKNILNHTELDEDGRCIETDHGEFVIINVYAPHDGERSVRLGLKMTFLLRVYERIKWLKSQNRKVIFVGDMNAKLNLRNIRSEMIVVDLNLLCGMDLSSFAGNVPPSSFQRLHAFLKNPGILETLRKALESKEFVQSTRSNSKVKKFEAYVRNLKTGEKRRINMNDLWESERCEGGAFDFAIANHSTIDSLESLKDLSFVHGGEIPANEEDCVRWVSHRGNCLRLYELQVALFEIFDFAKFTEQEISDLIAFYDPILHPKWLRPSFAECTTLYLNELLINELGMREAIDYFFPQAQNRFTVWTQMTNQRYSNFGSRVDYIFVDCKLQLVPPILPLFGCDCCPPHHNTDDGKSANEILLPHHHVRGNDLSALSALRASTCFGNLRAAPMEGGGIPEAPEWCYSVHFRKRKTTGIVYTPPEYSDHIPITCLIQLDEEKILFEAVSTNEDTKHCRPHIAQRKISDMFNAMKNNNNNKKPKLEEEEEETKIKVNQNKNTVGGIMAYFKKKDPTA